MSSRKFSIGVAAAFSVGLFSMTGVTTAIAATPKAGAVFDKFDADHDGTLSLDEVKTAAAARFDALEKDGDGTLDQAEASKAGIKGKEMTQADPDKDGTVSKDEYLSIVNNRFAMADKDHDGTLTKSEMNSKAGKDLLKLIG